jgi:hypothetical protein
VICHAILLDAPNDGQAWRCSSQDVFGTHDPTPAVQKLFEAAAAKLLLASSAATAGTIWLVPGPLAIGR